MHIVAPGWCRYRTLYWPLHQNRSLWILTLKNCTRTRQLSVTYGNPFVTKIYKNTTIHTFIYKTKSTLLQINNVYFGTVQYRFAWFHKWWYCWIIVYSIINQTVFTGAFRLEFVSKGPVVDHCCQNGYEMELRILKK